ncbi:MAG: PEP-CTERM sorting domain-containing protein [Acidobacteriota bacterium]|nr:PEP-CTERM sorting domain-containing protein [Acidobacteriota bacterium]
MKSLLMAALFGSVLSIGSMHAAPLFSECPAVGSNTGCQFLITVNADNTTTVAEDTVAPNNGPYDASDDTLVGVLNNSSKNVNSLPISSSTTIFGFEGDGACTQTPAPASCGSDSSGYGGPNATFSGISADTTSGTVNFPTGLAAGQSTWFALEDSLTLSQITPGTPGTGPGTGPSSSTPEPGSLLTLGTGLLGLGLYIKRAKRA